MSTTTFTYEFESEAFVGKVNFPTGLFINGGFCAGKEGNTIDVINPSNGKVITSVADGTMEDVDHAVNAARVAFNDSWGFKVPGAQRGEFLNNVANLMTQHVDE